jgi:hypothetical protein
MISLPLYTTTPFTGGHAGYQPTLAEMEALEHLATGIIKPQQPRMTR